MTFPTGTAESLNSYYGNPDLNSDGRPDPKWESANLVRIRPPYPMFWSWDMTGVRSITLHAKCAPAFLAALEGIRDAFSEYERKRFQLDRCGGGYNFRLMRGANRLSVHSWGAALDLAPELNWLGRKYDAGLGMMPAKAVEIFAAHGLKWGGRWSRPDAMHFQATL